MNNRKIDKCVKKVLRQMERERKRCAKQYPDWRDDEFNNLDNKFIWGCPPRNSSFTKTPSFNSWDDAYIYFNRADGKYYMEIDTGFYGNLNGDELAQEEFDRLEHIEMRFTRFLIENHLQTTADIFPMTDPSLSAPTLSELYVKFRIMLEGYKRMREYKVITRKEENK